MTPMLLIVTLMFADGRQEKQTYEFTDIPHARDVCRAKEVAVIEELRQQAQRGLLKGYSIVTCHEYSEAVTDPVTCHLATAEEKAP